MGLDLGVSLSAETLFELVRNLLALYAVWQIGEKFYGRRVRIGNERLAHRKVIREELARNLAWIDRSSFFGELILRDIRRPDEYPRVPADGYAAWCKCTAIQIKENHLRMATTWVPVVREPKTNAVRLANWKTNESGSENLLLVYELPYDRIARIEWVWDDAYGSPQVFCDFKRKFPAWRRPALCDVWESKVGASVAVSVELLDAARDRTFPSPWFRIDRHLARRIHRWFVGEHRFRKTPKTDI